jgi:integrase
MDQELVSVSPEWLARLVSEMSGQAPVHAQRALAYTAPFFAWALDEGLIQQSPIAHIGREKARPPRDRILSLEEVRRVWAASIALARPFGPAVQLLILTAAFRDDVAALRLAELSGVGPNWIWRPNNRAMGEGGFDIPLSSAAVQVLENQLSLRLPGSDFVFSTTGTTPISGWSRAKRRLDGIIASQVIDAVPLHPWRFNDLRQSFAVHSRETRGINPIVVERCLGRISGIVTPLGREWAASPNILTEHRDALERWAAAVTAI